jgi:hypothetical protein
MSFTNEFRGYIENNKGGENPCKESLIRERIGAVLHETLYPYQKEALAFLVRNGGCGLLSLEMGLGKTIVSICLMLFYVTSIIKKRPIAEQSDTTPDNKFQWGSTILVVCPAKVCSQFADAINKWTGIHRSRILVNIDPVADPADWKKHQKRWKGDTAAENQANRGPDSWQILSYSKARRCSTLMKARNCYSGLICDESQNLKNHKSACVQNLLPVFAKIKRRVLLSGIPLNISRHIYSQLRVINPILGPFSNVHKFLHHFCGPRKVFIGPQKFHWSFNGSTNTEQLFSFLRSRIVFRLTRETIENGYRVNQEHNNLLQDVNPEKDSRGTRPNTALDAEHQTRDPFSVKRRKLKDSSDDTNADCTKRVRHREVVWVSIPDGLMNQRMKEVKEYEDITSSKSKRDKDWTDSRDWKSLVEANPDEQDSIFRKKQEFFMKCCINTAKFKVDYCRQYLVNYVRGIQERGEKVLLFAVHHSVLAALESIVMEALSGVPKKGDIGKNKARAGTTPMDVFDPALAFVEKWNPDAPSAHPEETPNGVCDTQLPYIRIDGKTGRDAAKYVHRFQTDDTCKVAILSVLAAGTGIELQSGNNVLFVEITFNIDDLLQAEGRVFRIGQKRDVHISYLMIQHSIEEAMFEIVKRKWKNVNGVLCNKTDGLIFENRIIQV